MARLGDMNTLNSKSKAESAKEQNLAIPVQRPGKTLDIANVALFFASPAGNYVSGTNIVVDGG